MVRVGLKLECTPGTKIEWSRPSAGEIVVAARGEIDAETRDLFVSVIRRAIARNPHRITVRICGPYLLDPASRDVLEPLARQARVAGVEFVVDE